MTSHVAVGALAHAGHVRLIWADVTLTLFRDTMNEAMANMDTCIDAADLDGLHNVATQGPKQPLQYLS
jgi:hypothetical protein